MLSVISATVTAAWTNGQCIFSRESIGAVSIYSVGSLQGFRYIFSRKYVGAVSKFSVGNL